MTDSGERKEAGLDAARQTSDPDERPPDTGLAQLFREHHERLFRAAYRITGNAADAEDVTQVVFLRLVRREGGVTGDGTASYLHRAAVNAALDVVRARRASRADGLDEATEPTADPRGGPERLRGDGEIRDALRRALASLSPRAAEVFALRYLEGYDNHEIARLLRMPRMTVGVVLHRARARLRHEMEAFAGGWR
jgi:RNA polymerase sigma-70 factor (ECF subfamily)